MAPFTCPICSECFASKDNLLSHTIDVHNIFMPSVNGDILCWYCDESYNNRYSCLTHILTSHQYILKHSTHYNAIVGEYYEYNASCPSCDIHLRSREELQRHYFSCKSTTCPYCSKPIKWKRNLKGHMQTCNMNPSSSRSICNRQPKLKSKFYTCNTCQSAFTNRVPYLAHMAIHGQEIPSQSNDYGTIKLHQQALNGRCGIYRMTPNLLEHSPDNFFNQMDRLLKKNYL